MDIKMEIGQSKHYKIQNLIELHFKKFTKFGKNEKEMQVN